MKKLLVIAAVTAALAMPASADFYVAGDFNGWNAAGNLMNNMGGGIYQVTLSGLGAGARHEFKITQGDWSWNIPGPGNSWLLADGSGDVTLTYDVNSYGDGWSAASGRIGSSVDPGTWTAVGDWQGWNNANGATAMTSLGGGIYRYEYLMATPGTYYYKAVNTGTWDAIGADARGVNADNLAFTTVNANQYVDFYVNALNGTIRVDLVPEPSSLALLGSALAFGICWRRRR